MKLRIRLENFKGVFARMWFNIAMTSDRLSFASVEIDKSYSFTLPPWRNLWHRWSRDQRRPGSLFPTTREAEERDPGNEVAKNQKLGLSHFTFNWFSSLAIDFTEKIKTNLIISLQLNLSYIFILNELTFTNFFDQIYKLRVRCVEKLPISFTNL